jgi:hypothetical protein
MQRLLIINLIHAAETGIGLHELEASRTHRDRQCWAPLLRWLEKSEENPDRWVSATRSTQLGRQGHPKGLSRRYDLNSTSLFFP